jgi:hypothetical protein
MEKGFLLRDSAVVTFFLPVQRDMPLGKKKGQANL